MSNPPVGSSPVTNAAAEESVSRYWRKNLQIMGVLLLIWAAAGLGAGILFADTLNAWQIGGYPLGFWFAQQGSIIVFVVLILVYALAMNRLDRLHREELAEAAEGTPDGGAQ